MTEQGDGQSRARLLSALPQGTAGGEGWRGAVLTGSTPYGFVKHKSSSANASVCCGRMSSVKTSHLPVLFFFFFASASLLLPSCLSAPPAGPTPRPSSTVTGVVTLLLAQNQSFGFNGHLLRAQP